MGSMSDSKMEYVRLGRTGLRVSRLGLGAMGMGNPAWRPWVLSEEASKPIIFRALDLGINFFDTSNYYSAGTSEEILGRVLLPALPRDEIVVATKVGNPMGKGPNARGYGRKHIIRAVDESLRRLNTSYIDLYQTHIWSNDAPLEETVEAFDTLVRAGKVLHVGITTMPAWQLARALGIAERDGRVPFASVQNHYNLVYREDERDMVPLCRAEGLGLIPFSPMARGFLAGDRPTMGEGPTMRARTDEYCHKWYYRPGDLSIAARTGEVAARYGVKPAQIGLAWTLAKQGITAPIFGATTPDQIDAAVAALSIRLEPADMAYLEEPYEPRWGEVLG
jgi:aryl-alcohol dehydrogenase-like predicted oxidoreductase